MTKALTPRTAPFTETELALITQRREEWLAVGRSTQPADRATAEAALTKMYGVLNLPRPVFIWGRSPVESLYFGVIMKALIDKKFLSINGDRLWDQLRGQLGDQLGDQLRGQLGDQLGDQLRGQLGDQLWDQLRGQLGDQLGDQLRDQLGDQLRDQLRDQLGDQLRDQLGGQLGDQLGDQLTQTWHWGAHDSAWVAFYEVGKELGVTYTDQLAERLDWHQDLCRSALWVQSFSGICFVSERPTHQTLNERGQLHNETGPAMRFGDDYRLYAWHGVRVPAWVIETPAEQLTVAQVTGEANQEVRRVLLERMGWGRYLRESGAVARQEDMYGKLYSIPVDNQRTLGIVEVVNGTPEPLAGDYTEDAGYVHKADGRWYKKYFLRVPSAMTTAHQAVAWTYFETPDSYAPLSRT